MFADKYQKLTSVAVLIICIFLIVSHLKHTKIDDENEAINNAAQLKMNELTTGKCNDLLKE